MKKTVESFLQAAPDAMLVVDTNGTIVFANEQTVKLFGYDRPNELNGQPIEVLVPERVRNAHVKHRSSYLLAPYPRPMLSANTGVDLYGRRKNGEEFPVEISLSPVEMETGVLVCAAIRDISVRRSWQKAAEDANRIKDEFLATLSHELRTPLTSILGWTTVLASKTLDADSTNRAIHSIMRSARQQASLIDDLLDMSRIITGKLRLTVEPVALTPVVEAAVDAIRPAASAKSIGLEVVLDSSDIVVPGDHARLQQIVWNLMSNAVRYTPKGGHILVTLERIDSKAEVTVKDSGRGISPSFLPYVFDRFRQADSTTTRATGGLGLGLAIVRHLVDLHGGTVEAQSEGENRGATFRVRLPIRPIAATRGRATPALTEKPRPSDADVARTVPIDLRGVVVLVVDDDEATREALQALISLRGGQTVGAASVAEALDFLAKNHPDVLICDIGMPEEDGYSLIRQVRLRSAADGGRTPAIALTAYARAEDRTRALLAGFQTHVAKPAEPTELLAVVAALVGRTGPSSELLAVT
jgi:PAS domain S-box-containing protein